VKNFIQPGDYGITLVAPANVVAGQLISVGKINGVVACDAVSGAQVEVAVEGVYSLPKTPGDTITQGQQLHALATGVIDASGTILVGYAVAAAASGTSTVSVRLVPSAA
jgi:predicted RecA/RadA family phage recombinase